MSFFTVISVHFRYHLSVLVPARFVTFFFPMERKIKVRLRRAVAGNCPPDSCIWVFKSDGPVSPKRKSTPDGVLFFLLLVYTLDISFDPNFLALKTGKIQIFRSQVSTIRINTR